MPKQNADAAGQTVRIWDIWIRLFHWLLAVAVLFLLVSGTTGWQFFEWHRRVGEIVLALWLFRLCWGLVGSDNARLHRLLVNPVTALAHIGHVVTATVEQVRGHNAAGGWAVLLMLALVGFQALSGLFIADEEEFIEGAFYGVVSTGSANWLLYLHQLNGDLLKLVVGLHVLMIAVYALRASHNLIGPMITGTIRWRGQQPLPPLFFQRGWVGLLIALAVGGGVGAVLSWW